MDADLDGPESGGPMCSIRRGGWICLFCFSLISGFSQSGNPDRRITLDVVVTDKSGKPVTGLQQQDFTLLDNKQPQKILSFQAVEGAPAEDSPAQVVLLVDEVNIPFRGVSEIRTVIEEFLSRNAGALTCPTSLAYFSDSGMTIGNAPTRDGNALITALKQRQAGLRTIGRSQGLFGDADRLNLSLRAIQQLANDEVGKPGQKLVIWFGPGWSFLASQDADMTSKQKEDLFGNIVSASDELRQARITLYNIDARGTDAAVGGRASEYKSFSRAVKTAQQAQIGNLALQVLASQSGGRLFNPSNNVAGNIAAAVADANAYYVISFDGLTGDGPNEYHAVDIKIDKPKLVTRARSGYYAQPALR
jgi:VWFA-related protein